ncbi:unnamed protein product, partial [Rotaria sp. Silwood1]
MVGIFANILYKSSNISKRLEIDSFPRFKELCVYNNPADGIICLDDIKLLLKFFPNLE